MPAVAADPMATDYSYAECCGSQMPYPDIKGSVVCPDSLEPVFINHVGRHGARFLSSPSYCTKISGALQKADSLRTITPLGRKLMALVDEVQSVCDGNWGALDALGEEEQRGIASRMYFNYPEVFKNASVRAISSYSPRCMMSMYCFLHQLDRLDNKIEFSTATGRVNSELLRPFDIDEDYKKFRASDELKDTYDRFFERMCPVSAISRVLGKDFEYSDDAERRDLAFAEYHVLAALDAMQIDAQMSDFLTLPESNALWSCMNLRHYLNFSSSTLSTEPADMSAPLLIDLIKTTEDFIDGRGKDTVFLRFGHAETLMPLLSLMHINGCYYMTNYFDTVAKHWRDFYIVPMAANLQLVLLRHTGNGKYYMRVDLNEKPVPLIPNSDALYTPWSLAREYLRKCVPMYLDF